MPPSSLPGNENQSRVEGNGSSNYEGNEKQGSHEGNEGDQGTYEGNEGDQGNYEGNEGDHGTYAMKVTTAMKDTLAEDEEKIRAMEEDWQREKAWQLAKIAQMGGDDGGGGGGGSERVWREGASVKFRCIYCGSICAARNIRGEPTTNQWSCGTCGSPQPPWC